MKHILSLAMLTLSLTSCYRDSTGYLEQQLNMRYTELKDAEMGPGVTKRVDLDGDGTTDFSFNTLLVGDPVLMRDRLQFYVNSKIKTNLLNDNNDESPVFNKGEQIKLTHAGYTWYEISAIVLTEKITPLSSPVFWQGLWKNAHHKYLPVQIEKTGGIYIGWIELSFNQVTQKLILHRAAISTLPNTPVKAGY